jgi:predicted nucleic acid-binding protein
MAPPRAYFDTSALIKRYLREEGSVRVRALLRRKGVLSAAIITVELASALSRRRSEGDLSGKDFAAIVSRIHEDRAYWHLIELSPLVLTRAEELVQKSILRMFDAIHVAAALVFEEVSGVRLPFVTGDSRQAEATRAFGLEVIQVG